MMALEEKEKDTDDEEKEAAAADNDDDSNNADELEGKEKESSEVNSTLSTSNFISFLWFAGVSCFRTI